MKKKLISLILCVRKMSSIVATFLVITTLVSFLGMALIKKYNDDSFQVYFLFVAMLVYLLITIFDILMVAKIENSFSGYIRAVLALIFGLLTYIAFFHGIMTAEFTFQQFIKT